MLVPEELQLRFYERGPGGELSRPNARNLGHAISRGPDAPEAREGHAQEMLLDRPRGHLGSNGTCRADAQNENDTRRTTLLL